MISIPSINTDFTKDFSSISGYNPAGNILGGADPTLMTIPGVIDTYGAGGGGLTGFGDLFKDIGGLKGIGDLLGGFGAIGTALLGSDQLDLQEEMFGFQKDAFNANFANQAQSANTALEDRQRSRTLSTGNPNQNRYESIASYMDKNKVSGTPIG